MPLESKEKTINGRLYCVTQMPAMQSLKLLARLGGVAGPAMAEMFARGADGEVDLGKVTRLLFDKLDEKETEELIGRLCASVTVIENGEQRSMMKGFDLAYAGERLLEVFEVISFVFEVQYGPTFAALLAARAAMQPAAKTAPATSA